MNKPHQGAPRAGRPLRKLMVAAVAAAIAASAHAGETVEFDNGVKVDWTASVGYTAAWRMKEPSAALTGAANAIGDDGDLNFKKGKLINNRVSALGEANIHRDGTGFFIRASTFYDDVYHRGTDNPGGTLNTLQPANEFTSDARYYNGGRTRLLDSYGYTTVALGNAASANLRLGRHVVSWGEAFVFSTMAGAQAPTDVSKALIPGTEVKDYLLPVNQFSANFQVNSNWSVGTYVQFESRKSEMPPVGSYLWGTDIMGPGATCMNVLQPFGCVFGPRTADENAKNGGQWGINTRYRITDTDEVGLYYFNYHDRSGTPVFNFSDILGLVPAAEYHIKYFENIKTIGLTYATRFGDWQVSAEGSLKDGMPVLVKTGAFTTPTRAKVTQFSLSGYKLLGNSPISDGGNIILEYTQSHIGSVNSATLSSSGAAVADTALIATGALAGFGVTCATVGTCGSYSELDASNTKNAAAIAAIVNLDYNGIANGLDMTIPIVFMHGLHGANPTTMAGLNSDKDGSFSIGAKFKYLSNFEIGASYTKYLGTANPVGLKAVPYADRDFLSLTAKYNF